MRIVLYKNYAWNTIEMDWQLYNIDSRKSLKGRITAEFQPGAAHEKIGKKNLEETLHGGKNFISISIPVLRDK